MNDAAARTLSVTFTFIVKYLHPQYTIRNYILNASKEMMIKLTIPQGETQRFKCHSSYYYRSVEQTNVIHSLNVAQQFGQQKRSIIDCLCYNKSHLHCLSIIN